MHRLLYPQRELIELGLMLGRSADMLTRRFGFNCSWPLRNHRDHHLTPAQKAAILTVIKPSEIDLEQLQRTESEGLLGALVGQRARLQQLMEIALEERNVHAAVTVERSITANLELTARLVGQLIQVHEVRHTNLLVSPDYLKLRNVLVETLRKHPDAAKDVSAALHRLESDAAKDITAQAKAGKPLLIDASPLREEVPAC